MGAGLAARTAPSDMVVGAAPARSILSIRWQWFWRQVTALLIGTVVVVAPLVVKVWLNAPPAGVEIADLIDALLSFVALVAVAHVVAAVVSHPIVWMLAPVVCIVVVWIPSVINQSVISNTGYSSVAFAWSLGMVDPSGTFTTTAAAAIMRGVFFVIVALSCILAASRWSMVRSGGFTWRRVAPCAALVAPPLIIAAMGVVMPVPLFREGSLAFECSSYSKVRVCVTSPHRSLAPSYAEIAQRVMSVMPQTVSSRDILLAESGYHAPQGQRVINLGLPTSLDSRQELSNQTSQGLAQSMSGVDACEFMHTNGEMTPQQIDASDGVNSVERTILRLAGFPYEDMMSSEKNDLDSMDAATFGQWYIEHRQMIMTCSLTDKDLRR